MHLEGAVEAVEHPAAEVAAAAGEVAGVDEAVDQEGGYL